jgi:hypothetical protein
MSKNNTLLYVGILGAVGYYLYSKGYFATVLPPAVPTGPTVLPQGNNETYVNPVPPPTVQPGVSTSQQPGSQTPYNPMADSRMTEILLWVNTLTGSKLAAAKAALPLMSPDEVAGLYDIVFNDFYGNGVTTAAQAAFWNTWRAKYNYQ